MFEEITVFGIDLGFALIVLNYAALAGTFIWAYLTPKQNAAWLAASENYFFVAPMTLVFLGIMLPFLPQLGLKALTLDPGVLCVSIPVGVLFILILVNSFADYTKRGMKAIHGRTWLLPALLFVGSFCQELVHIVTMPQAASKELVAWYFGLLVVVTLLSRLSEEGGDLFSEINEEHKRIARAEFGIHSPYLPGLKEEASWTPAGCMVAGVVYCIWMVLRYVLLP